jgi:hypothetical protein
MKTTIMFKRTYNGEDKSHIKNGDRIWMTYNKEDIRFDYKQLSDMLILQNRPNLSLLMYVRQRVDRACKTGKL